MPTPKNKKLGKFLIVLSIIILLFLFAMINNWDPQGGIIFNINQASIYTIEYGCHLEYSNMSKLFQFASLYTAYDPFHDIPRQKSVCQYFSFSFKYIAIIPTLLFIAGVWLFLEMNSDD